MSWPTKVIMVVADVLVPNRHQDIRNHNTALTVIIAQHVYITQHCIVASNSLAPGRCHFHMMTLSSGNIFRVTGHLCGEFKGQWRRALMFPLICVWINGWENNREAGDLRHCRAHYDIIVMKLRSKINSHIYHENFLWNCTQGNDRGSHWLDNIGSGNGLVLSGNEPLAEPVLTQIFIPIWCHLASQGSV